MTSSWFFLSTLNYDARSTTHQIYSISSSCDCTLFWIRSAEASKNTLLLHVGGSFGSRTALQAGRSRVQFPLGGSLRSLIDLFLSDRTMASGVDSVSDGKEYQRYLVRGRRGRCVDLTNFHVLVPITLKSGSPDLEPIGPVQACTGITGHN